MVTMANTPVRLIPIVATRGKNNQPLAGIRQQRPIGFAVPASIKPERTPHTHDVVNVCLELRGRPEVVHRHAGDDKIRSEEHTSELQSPMRTSYAVFCLKKKKNP